MSSQYKRLVELTNTIEQCILKSTGVDLLWSDGRVPRRGRRGGQQVDGRPRHHGLIIAIHLYHCHHHYHYQYPYAGESYLITFSIELDEVLKVTVKMAKMFIQDETCAIYVARGHDNGMPCSKVGRVYIVLRRY